MVKGFSKKLNNAKVKRFLFFLVIAGIFWIFTKFSREFSVPMQTKIEYKNIPETAALAKNNIHQLDFDLTANGFEILFYKFQKPNIEVNVSKYFLNKKMEFEIPYKDLFQLVNENFSSSKSIKNLSVETLKVNLDPIVQKKVPVIVKSSISYKDGFKAVDSLKVEPDSVLISGPAKILKDIKHIETDILKVKDVDKNFSETITIKKTSDDIISIKPTKVTVMSKVDEFSQGEYTIPIEVINVPPNTEIKLIPATITLKFDVSVNDFARISKDNFRVVCDFTTMNKEGKFMIPYLELKPENIHNVVFEPKKVDLLIVK